MEMKASKNQLEELRSNKKRSESTTRKCLRARIEALKHHTMLLNEILAKTRLDQDTRYAQLLQMVCPLCLYVLYNHERSPDIIQSINSSERVLELQY